MSKNMDKQTMEFLTQKTNELINSGKEIKNSADEKISSAEFVYY